MKIRRAQRGDVEELRALYRQMSGQSYEDNPLAIGMALVSDVTEVYVVEADGKVVGTGTLSVRVVPSHGLVGYIDDVVVSKTSRRQGAAKMIMGHLEDRARERGCRLVQLTSSPKRHGANVLYRVLGYALIQTNCYRKRLE